MDTTEIKGLIARSKKPETFIFTGFRSDVSNIVKAVDLSISVSLFGEATQKAMIEAMYVGNPVIISDIPGNRGMAIDGEGGYVIEPNNPKSIAEAIVKFHENPSQWGGDGRQGEKTHHAIFESRQNRGGIWKLLYLHCPGQMTSVWMGNQ